MLKHISILVVLIMSYSLTAFGQVEDEEVQIYSFGSSRGLSSKNVHDFGAIKKVTTFTIELQNTGDTKMQVGDISIPGQVGVTILKKVIKPGDKGGIIVTVDPQLFKKGKFNRKVVISTVTQKSNGTIVKKTAAYNLKGQIL